MGKVVLTNAELREIANEIVAGERINVRVETLTELAKGWLKANPEPKDLPPLTERQIEVVNVMRKSIAERSIHPSIREIMSELGIRSPNGVMCHMKALERKGVVVRTGHISRGTVLAEQYR